MPTPVTWRSQGTGPIGEAMDSEPEQPAPSSCPAVWKLRSGTTIDGKVLATYVDTLFGRACCMNWMNWGVSTEAALLKATFERSTSPERKKNVWSFRIGPPRPQAYSVRLKFGIELWKTFFSCSESFE